MFKEIAASLLLPPVTTPLFPDIDNRKAWDALDEHLKKQLIQLGEPYLNGAYPQILATDYMEFTRTGNRTNYQDKVFQRRIALNALVLAECVENRGRFLDHIVNGIVLICEESAWQIPAHNAYLRDTPQFSLPDITRPVIDLFAAETAAVLGVSEMLLRSRFDAVSPFLSKMINEHLNHRIFDPYLNEHFWWMGDGVTPMNNWTVWCTQNVLLAAFTRPLPDQMQHTMLQKACQSTDYFLAEYGDDGCCDEGAQYYRHAGLCLFNIIELLNHRSANAFGALYREPKIKNIAAYIWNVHVDGPYYINFADCSPLAGRCNAREYLFGKRTGNRDLMTFAAFDYQTGEDPLLTEEHNLFYRMQTIFNHQEMCEVDTDQMPEHLDCYYESVGLWIARDSTYCLAVKAGDNNDSHNHNDTGSFTLYKHGLPLFIDVGVETYTKKTFSPQRYELWPMQSGYHNLLTFDGVMQKDGADYSSREVNTVSAESSVSISMELSGAYPDSRIRSYHRNVEFKKNNGITITDRFQCSQSPVVLSLMTYEKPEWQPEKCCLQIGTLEHCRIKGAGQVIIEAIPITDERLAQTWKHEIYRTLITVADSMIELTITE